MGNFFVEGVGTYFVIPLIALIGGALILMIKQQVDRVVKSFVAKNEISNMEKKNAIRKDLIDMIEKHVTAGVASNMQLAEKLKETGQKLNEAQIAQLNETVKTLTINSLPASLTEQDGVLLEIIGGQDRLDAIIASMMEKAVYEYKAAHPPKIADRTYQQPDECVG